MSANPDPSSYVTRNVPSYYGAAEDSITSGNNSSSSPRYSPNFHQSWRRQHSQSSLSFMPSAPRPEHSEYTTSQSRRQGDRGPICISPFRSVRRMKQPFQLVLPTSPSIDSSPSLGKESRTSRRLSGNPTLRTWRSDGNLMVKGLFSLLPSPPLSDSPVSHPSPCPSSTYFSPKPESEPENDEVVTNPCGCRPEAKLCDTCSSPQPESQVEDQKTNDTTNVQLTHSTLVEQCGPEKSQTEPTQDEPVIMESPVIPPGLEAPSRRNISGSYSQTQRSRATTVSSDTSWMPSSFSNCENWLQGVPIENMDVEKGFNRRKIQIVEKSDRPLEQSFGESSINTGSSLESVSEVPLDERSQSTSNNGAQKAPDEPVKLAVAERTAVPTRTKPKLVDISRQSSPGMSYSIPTPHHTVPSTPDQRQFEVSAFSPDTPLEMSDSGYITHHSFDSPGDFPEDKVDDASTDSGSLASESVSSTIVCDKQILTPETPYSPPKASIQPTFSPVIKPQASPGCSSNISEKEQLQKWWDHEWTIDQLEQSVREFPRQMLRLTSPAIMFLRENNEKALIRPFRKIFPEGAENMLDCLCATLIARNYIVSLAASNRPTNNFSHKPTLSRLDPVPEKASTFGIKFAQPTPNQIKDRVLGTRSVKLRKDLDQIVDNLLVAICGHSDETLKSAVLVLAQVLESKA
ncbi:hypothetical protein ASPWEDRAFT_29351 [Aspergillus wentii DTO 134E9]|uniref:Uncharacterized protein n=1 Tax=Aspergillus wentii DTO 134E9 TaxID=1073089 RepID=A0A1L9RH64_ASPWE|nr:uncharacterized protein ASPWEDRAFT_29351 [Aspergillus wentii DTO 134E9]OJJ34187.1 hypothetical protein ASPWEDRAFT_29351 [Aspergillus wentii DTO 134E9]